MDPFAHLQEIKLVGMLILGFFCYRRLKRVYDEPLEDQISDQQIMAEDDPHECPEQKPAQSPQDALGLSRPEDCISEAKLHKECDQAVNELAILETAQLDKENMTGPNGPAHSHGKKKLIRKARRRTKRPILRPKCVNSVVIA